MAASMVVSPSQLSSPLGSAIGFPLNGRTQDVVYKKRPESHSHRKRNVHPDHVHSAKRESCRSSAFVERVHPVPSGSVDSTIRRTNFNPAAHRLSVNECTHSGANGCDSSPAASAERERSKQLGRQNKPVSPTNMPRQDPPRKRPSSPHPSKLKKAEAKRANAKAANKGASNSSKRASSAADSGRGEELNSSCDSDSVGKTKGRQSRGGAPLCNGGGQSHGEAPLYNGGGQSRGGAPLCNGSGQSHGGAPLCNGGGRKGVKKLCSGGPQQSHQQSSGACRVDPCSGGSDVEEDVFVDALSSLPDSASTSAFMTPRSPSPPPSNEVASSSSRGESAKDKQLFAQDLTKCLKKVERDRSDSSDRSNETSSGVGASVDTNDDQVNGTAISATSRVGPTKGNGKGTSTTTSTSTSSLADKENAGNNSSAVSKGKPKNRSKKRPNGLQEPPNDAPIIDSFTSVDDQADSFVVEKKRKGSPKGKKKKKGPSNNAGGVAAATQSSLKVPQEVQHGSKLNKQGGSGKAAKPGGPQQQQQQQQQVGLENSSISSASPPSSVCSHSPLTLSPSPTSSFSSQMMVAPSVAPTVAEPLQKLLARPNLGGTQPTASATAAAAEEGSEGKDEWPDLDFGTPSPLPKAPKVHKHLDVEAKSLESSPECRTEEEDSGCSMSIGSTSELLAAAPGAAAASKQAKLSPPLRPLPTPVPSASGFRANAPPFNARGGGGLLGTPFGDALLPPPLPPHNQHHLSSQHYLWMQSQQLKVFVQQHQEQQEKQTTNHIFFPVEPMGQPPSHVSHLLCPTQAPPPLLQHPPLPQLSPFPPPLLQHHLPPPHLPLPPPRPLFFPPQVALHRPTAKHSDPFSPPTPPPPPPLPVHPYLPANANQLCKTKAAFKPAEATPDPGPSLAPEDVVKSKEEDKKEEKKPFVRDPNYKYHPLQHTWVMWFDKITGSHRNTCANYQASLKQLFAVPTIEEFWQVHNNLIYPSEMENNSNFHFFKDGIRPLWEDPANKNGGKWVFTIKNDPETLSKSWLEVLLVLIGGCTERKDQMNGAVVSRRKKGDRVSLWTNTRNEKANLDICWYFIKALFHAYNTPPKEMKKFVEQLAENKNGSSLVFMHHCDSLKSGHSYQNDAHIMLTDHLDVIFKKVEKLH